MRNRALILAAGTSTRFQSADKDKLLANILGLPVIYHTLVAFHEHEKIYDITIVANKKNIKAITQIVKKYRFPKVTIITRGGETRLKSLIEGLKNIQDPQKDDLILVHNGANPLVSHEEITKVIIGAKGTGAAAVGQSAVDTIKEIKDSHYIKTHDRKNIVHMQTPQAAKFSLLQKAARIAKKDYTDETSLLESIDIKVKHIPAHSNNFKITTQQDLERAKLIMGDTPKNFLIGFGQDSHKFSLTKKGLTLGGHFLKNEPKLEADSDGDVILHALANACAQAIGEGSLGRFATPMYEKGIKESTKYFQKIHQKIKRQKYQINNIGIMIEGARPKIDPLVPAIKKQLSLLTTLPTTRIGITATTGEKLTSFGKGEGLQCFAVISLKKHED